MRGAVVSSIFRVIFNCSREVIGYWNCRFREVRFFFSKNLDFLKFLSILSL